MNLHSLASGAINAVNPAINGTIARSAGYSIAGDGTQTPIYVAPEAIKIQLQALQLNELKQLDGLNIQGDKSGLYLFGNAQGVNRPDGLGGDLVTLENGSIYLVTLVLENWSAVDGWCKVVGTRQN